MHPRMARLQYLLGGEAHRFQNIWVEGPHSPLLINKCWLYLFISCFLRLRGPSEAPLYYFKSVHDKATKIINKKIKCY